MAAAGIFDDLAKFYMSVDIIWTAALLVGAVLLVLNRREQCIRIRNLPLALGSVACLHIYWILCMAAYSMGAAYPCGVEYWIMSVYLPLGIALFQANSMQLLSVSGIQEKMLHTAYQPYTPRPKSRQYLLRLKQMSLVQRTELGIAIGMAAQLIISLTIYLTSRKFNSFGTFSGPVSPRECRRGPEWIPSILWQLFWSWVFAPWILWKIRHIHDIHHWRLQITCCVIAALPGSPLWFAALHSDSWKSINQYWVPPLWFTPGIIAMEAVTIFLPLYELMGVRKQRDRIFREMQTWDEKKKAEEASAESESDTHSQGSGSHSQLSRFHELYSIKALEKCLEEDSGRLLHFAAAKEFSGENIIFLTCVRDWKAAWDRLNASKPDYDWLRDPQHHRLHFFRIAVEIYASCVDLKTADFPINIESRVYSDLVNLFGDTLQDSTSSSFYSSASPSPSPHGHHRMSRGTVSPGMNQQEGEEDTRVLCLDEYLDKTQTIMQIEPRIPDSVAIPPAFSPAAFDEAQKSILSLVFTNTWPKFLDSSSDDLSITSK